MKEIQMFATAFAEEILAEAKEMKLAKDSFKNAPDVMTLGRRLVLMVLKDQELISQCRQKPILYYQALSEIMLDAGIFLAVYWRDEPEIFKGWQQGKAFEVDGELLTTEEIHRQAVFFRKEQWEVEKQNVWNDFLIEVKKRFLQQLEICFSKEKGQDYLFALLNGVLDIGMCIELHQIFTV